MAPSTVAIIGSGFAGLCLAIQLKKAGIDDFVILEKADRLGGTWRDNVYPGAACDVPSISYCFSFEQKTDWSRKWASQREIYEYLEHCARKYDVLRHIRFATEVEGARYDDGVWRIRTTEGEEVCARVLVSAVGQLNRPHVPPIAGLSTFQGTSFHSARWEHSFDPSGKRVAVVGNAASAVQFIPELAKTAERLFVFQRSANWMLPKLDRAYTPREKAWLTRFPFLAWLYRFLIWLSLELRFPLFYENAIAVAMAKRLAVAHLEKQVASADLRRALTPDYPIGAKRILISDDYYPALQRPNVALVTSAIDHVTSSGIVSRDGEMYPIDAIILATGFDSTSFLAPMHLEGRSGLSLADAWKDGAQAYLGMSVSGFPNFFMMYGPNTNLGHNSIIFMLECQTRYIRRCIQKLLQDNLKCIEVRAEAMSAYNEDLQAKLGRTVWSRIEKSWYKDEKGRITNNWSGTTMRYWWRTRRVVFRNFVVTANTGARDVTLPLAAE